MDQEQEEEQEEHGWIMRYSGLVYNCQASIIHVETGKNGAPRQSTSRRKTALEKEEEEVHSAAVTDGNL